jgi:hypothetical protein
VNQQKTHLIRRIPTARGRLPARGFERDRHIAQNRTEQPAGQWPSHRVVFFLWPGEDIGGGVDAPPFEVQRANAGVIRK